MRKWIEDDNTGVEIRKERWLATEYKPGKVAPSLANYMKFTVEESRIRVGRRLFHTTRYDRDRGRADKGEAVVG